MDITDEFHRVARWKEGTKNEKDHIKDDFIRQSIEILGNVEKIAKIHLEKRRQYLDPTHYLPSKKSNSLTDADKEELEESIFDSFKLCEQQVEDLKLLVTSNNRQQLGRIYSEILQYLTERIKYGIGKTKQDQKNRIRRPFCLSKKLLPDGVDLSENNMTISNEIQVPNTSRPSNPTSHVSIKETNEMKFTPEERGQFHAENIQLHHHLHDEIDAARKVEMQVYDIQGMMHQFAQEIGGQSEKMEMISKDAENTIENIGDGNLLLKNANEYGQGFGFLIFCIYLSGSFLLLFFHYY